MINLIIRALYGPQPKASKAGTIGKDLPSAGKTRAKAAGYKGKPKSGVKIPGVKK